MFVFLVAEVRCSQRKSAEDIINFNCLETLTLHHFVHNVPQANFMCFCYFLFYVMKKMNANVGVLMFSRFNEYMSRKSWVKSSIPYFMDDDDDVLFQWDMKPLVDINASKSCEFFVNSFSCFDPFLYNNFNNKVI